jgi:multicomponent Na+:H+ antiporter subunit B
VRSLILRTATRALLPLLLVFSIFLLLRGHHEPGGGFVGGLVGGGTFALYALAHGPEEARRALRVDPRDLLGAGLLVAALSGLASLALGLPPFQGLWTTMRFPGIGELDLGTPLLFDVGVYLLVAGVTLTTLFALAEEE